MGDQTGESQMIRTYLDWLLDVPWGKSSEERLDPAYAREVLDADHAGSRTSRTASSSTWPFASFARSAVSSRTSVPARS